MPKKPAPPTPAKRPKERARREQRKAKGGSPKAAKTEARRATLLRTIRDVGLASLDVKAFAKAAGVAPKTIYEDLKLLSKEVGERGAEVIVLSALENLRRAKQEYVSILDEAKQTRPGPEGTDVPCITDSVRLGAAKALMDAAKAEIDALQRLGLLKGKAAELGSEENPLTVKAFDFNTSAYGGDEK